jgi:hypothetical protein
MFARPSVDQRKVWSRQRCGAERSTQAERLASFAAAYEELVHLQAEGKVAADGDFSQENLSDVRRDGSHLLRDPLDTLTTHP